MPNKNVSIVKKMNTFKAFLEERKNVFAEVLPRHLNPSKFLHLALSLARRNPKILQADIVTVASALMTCAELGLEPDVRGLVYLVPYYNKKMGTYDLQVIIGYKGFIDLARRSGQLSTIYAQIVYENDKFKLQYGTSPKIEHEPSPPDKRGEIKGVYAVSVMKDGSYQFDFMWKDEIEAIRKKAKTDNIWEEYWNEMAKKTVIRRLAKLLPLSPEFQKAVTIDEYAEVEDITGKDLYMDALPMDVVEELEEKEHAENVNERVKKTIKKTKGKAKELLEEMKELSKEGDSIG